ncbi:MAG: sulfite exporter TauE/SafE family protein [Chloroflexota bacterium]
MDINILAFILVGFVAQIIDGALGMAYGVSSNTFLLSIGIPPATASASVHMAEVFTTGISGFSHWRLGNIDKGLVKRLLIPGVLGGVAGAYLLTSIPGNIIKPFVSAYLLIMGAIIVIKALGKNSNHKEVKDHVSILGGIGGFFDAIGGGGWGPIVTTTLVARGNHPRFTIGSVNFTEFFVTFAESVTFILTLGSLNYWKVILGLMIGGVTAAPLAALVARKLPTKVLMFLVGILIILLSVRTIYLTVV